MWRFIGLPIYLFIGISCYPTNYKQPIWYGTQTVKGRVKRMYPQYPQVVPYVPVYQQAMLTPAVPNLAYNFRQTPVVDPQQAGLYYPPLGLPLKDMYQHGSYYNSLLSRQNIYGPNPNIIKTRNKVTHPKVNHGYIDREKEKILNELNTLQKDVRGFSRSLEGMAETVIDGKDKGMIWEEQLSSAQEQNKRKKILKDWINDTENTESKLTKQINKTIKKRSKFEGEMVNFFTQYVCGNDC